MAARPTSAKAARPPNLEIPPSTDIVSVSIIDTTTRIHMPVGSMFDPPIKGHTKLTSPSYAFLIEHPRLSSNVLFDLGVQKNWQEQAPAVVDMIREFGWDVQVEKDVAEILVEHGVRLDSIDQIVWRSVKPSPAAIDDRAKIFPPQRSHSHWDHLGDPSTFPASTGIIVGPGFSEEFFPGGVAEADSPIKKEYYESRSLREISLSEFDLNIGGFSAHDHFGDGSFYLIHSPGHDIGHLSALARTTINPDTFIFMGADIASHPGEFRPTRYIPIPTSIIPSPLTRFSSTSCPGHLFEQIHPEKRGTSPYYRIGTWPDGASCADDLPGAVESHQKLQVLDAQAAQIFVILAHDENIGDVVDFFPSKANRWKEFAWGDDARWMFLGDFKEALIA